MEENLEKKPDSPEETPAEESQRGQFITRYRKSKDYYSGVAFETEVAELYALLGAERVVRNRIIDGIHIDIYVEHRLPDNTTISSVVECKNYSKNVGIEEVTKFITSFKNLHYAGKADKGIVVSSTGFTAQSRQAAESFGIDLLEMEELRRRAEGLEKHSHVVLEEVTSETTEKKYVFILMPFDESFDDIFYFGIRGAVDDAGCYCERADEIQFTGGVMEKVVEQIQNADIVVAEMTGRNPNVFYEVGLAHAYNKPVILLVQSTGEIPFDLRNESHIVYNGKIKVLREKLGALLQSMT